MELGQGQIMYFVWHVVKRLEMYCISTCTYFHKPDIDHVFIVIAKGRL